MGLLDFDDDEIMRKSGIKTDPGCWRTEEADNFETLQNLGHKKNSEDFSDSPFADRRPQTYGEA